MVDSSNESSSSNEIPLIGCENISGSVFKAKNKLDGNYYAVK
jgi:hypothetical protein